MTSPCLGCTDRHLGCHSKCGRYLAWCSVREKEKEKVRKEKEKDAMFMEHLIRTKNKTR